MEALGAIATILPIINQLIGKFIPDPNQAQQLQNQITVALIQQKDTLITSMKDVMVADSQSESWLTRSTRPIVTLGGFFAIIWCMIFAPLFGLTEQTKVGLASIPPELWNLVMVGIGAYTLTRGAEKIANNIVGSGAGAAMPKIEQAMHKVLDKRLGRDAGDVPAGGGG